MRIRKRGNGIFQGGAQTIELFSNSKLNVFLQRFEFARSSAFKASGNNQSSFILVEILDDFSSVSKNQHDCWKPKCALKDNNCYSAIKIDQLNS